MDVWQFCQEHETALRAICGRTFTQHCKLHHETYKREDREAKVDALMSDVVYARIHRLAELYVPELGTFRRYVFHNIKRYVIKELEREKWLTLLPSRYIPPNKDFRDFEQADARLTVQYIMGHISDGERLFIYLRFYEQWTQEQIGEKLSMSKKDIRQLEATILERIRDGIS